MHSLLSTAHSLQHADSSSSLSLEALTDVVSVSPRSVLEQHLSGLAGSGQILQVLYLISGPETFTAVRIYTRHVKVPQHGMCEGTRKKIIYLLFQKVLLKGCICNLKPYIIVSGHSSTNINILVKKKADSRFIAWRVFELCTPFPLEW